jgi:hypothetical protein
MQILNNFFRVSVPFNISYYASVLLDKILQFLPSSKKCPNSDILLESKLGVEKQPLVWRQATNQRVNGPTHLSSSLRPGFNYRNWQPAN